jgi:VCBS repeat-containing protein
MPNVTDDIASTSQDTSVIINVLANDDPNLHVTGVTINPSLGTAIINADNTITFTPNASFDSLALGDSAPGSFQYTVKDAAGASAIGTVAVTVNGLNDAPVAHDDTATVADRQSVTIDVLANDVDVDRVHVLNIAGFTQPASGATLDFVDGKFVYTADVDDFDNIGAGQQVTDTFTYTIIDDFSQTSTATVTITVNGNSVPGQAYNLGNHDQTFTAGGGDDTVNGGNGKDVLNGAGGSDIVHGNNGNDIVLGGDGNDKLFGDNGSDTLDGGAGQDTMSGGAGPDLFVFDDNFGNDVITDFDRHNDRMMINHNELGSFGDLLGHASQVGSSVVITTDEGDATITLLNVHLSDLKSSEFLFA